jgi:hypothetical protein
MACAEKESFGSFEPKQITREIREREPPLDCEGSLTERQAQHAPPGDPGL